MRSADEPLFDVPPPRQWGVGDTVNVRCSWGDERAKVLGLGRVDGYPTAMVEFESGDIASVTVSAVSQAA